MFEVSPLGLKTLDWSLTRVLYNHTESEEQGSSFRSPSLPQTEFSCNQFGQYLLPAPMPFPVKKER